MSSIGRFRCSAERPSSNSFRPLIEKQFGFHTTESTESTAVKSKQRRQAAESNVDHNGQQNAKESAPSDGPAEEEGAQVEQEEHRRKSSDHGH
jgi:hypothetical protein